MSVVIVNTTDASSLTYVVLHDEERHDSIIEWLTLWMASWYACAMMMIVTMRVAMMISSTKNLSGNGNEQ